MGGNASANNMLTGGEGGSKKPDFVLTLYVYLPKACVCYVAVINSKPFSFEYGITERLHDNKLGLLQQLKFELVVLGNSKRHNVRCYTTSKNVS